jgi:hypothetical protein
MIGSGTQADVYTCKVSNQGGRVLVTKTKLIVDNLEIANKVKQ